MYEGFALLFQYIKETDLFNLHYCWHFCYIFSLNMGSYVAGAGAAPFFTAPAQKGRLRLHNTACRKGPDNAPDLTL